MELLLYFCCFPSTARWLSMAAGLWDVACDFSATEAMRQYISVVEVVMVYYSDAVKEELVTMGTAVEMMQQQGAGAWLL